MRCPDCGGKLKVKDVAQIEDNDTYRRMKCLECGRRVFSIEIITEPDDLYRLKWQEARPSGKKRIKEKSEYE